MGIGLGPQSLNPSSLATYDLLHSLRCEHWNALFGVVLAFRHSLASLSIPSLAVFCPLVVLGCWILCTAGSAVWEALASTNLESWLPGVVLGGGAPAGQCLSAAQGCHPHSHSSAIPTPSPTPSQAPGVGVEAPTNAGGRIDQEPTEGHTPLPAYLGLGPLKPHSYPKPHFFPSFQIPLD